MERGVRALCGQRSCSRHRRIIAIAMFLDTSLLRLFFSFCQMRVGVPNGLMQVCTLPLHSAVRARPRVAGVARALLRQAEEWAAGTQRNPLPWPSLSASPALPHLP